MSGGAPYDHLHDVNHGGPGPQGYRDDLPAYGPVGDTLPRRGDNKHVAPGHPRKHVPRAVEIANKLQTALECGDMAGMLGMLCDRLINGITSELHNTQLGARMSGHACPPPGSTGLISVVGIEDAAPIPLIAAGAAAVFANILTLPLGPNKVGALSSFGHAIEDPARYPDVEWKILVDGVAVYGPWFGQIGTLECPTLIGPFAIRREGQIIIQARNVAAAGPGNDTNVMAVVHGWEFSTTPHGEHWYKEFWRDSG